MTPVLFWTTILSPIVGAIAIIVALYIGHRSSKDAKKQIASIRNLMEVFIASQNPTIMEAKRQYEKQLHALKHKIKDAEEKKQMIHSPFSNTCGNAQVEEMEKIKEQQKKINNLLKEKKEVEEKLNLIQSYLDKSASQKPCNQASTTPRRPNLKPKSLQLR